MSNNYFYNYLKQIHDLYGDELIYKNQVEFSKYGMKDSSILFLIDDLDIDSKISSDVKDLFLKMLKSSYKSLVVGIFGNLLTDLI